MRAFEYGELQTRNPLLKPWLISERKGKTMDLLEKGAKELKMLRFFKIIEAELEAFTLAHSQVITFGAVG